MTKRILILTGEASGDLHAANLVHELQQYDSNIKFIGMGGNKMRGAGVEIVQDINQLSVIGFTEIFARLPFLYSVFKKIKNLIKKTSFDLVILVDCPGYNLRFAKVAKQAKQKVLYYISPQLWAWHQNRVKLIKKYIDTMAVVFPFEVEFYKKFAVNAHFVGHPLTHIVKPSMSQDEARKLYGLTNTPVIGIVPGSRRGEIKRMLPIMLAAGKIIKKQLPTAQFILPLASSLTAADLEPYLNNAKINVTLVSGQAYDIINASDAVMVTSGTATLETTLLKKPFVIIYKASFLTYLITKLVIKVQFLGLCNLLADKPIVKEFLQYDAKPQAIADEMIQLLANTSYRQTMIEELSKIKDSLKADNAVNLAELIINTLSSRDLIAGSRLKILSRYKNLDPAVKPRDDVLTE